jgi:hypothetical protein
MKIRIRGNSVRLRLLQSEVAKLATGGKVSEQIQFGLSDDEILTYTLQVSDQAREISAGLCQNEICVTLPTETAQNWIENNEEISLENEKNLGDDSLHILVEKDFVCLTRTDDPDNLDAFPNPDVEC